jgi:gliding motility-associated lipoprotein GldD
MRFTIAVFVSIVLMAGCKDAPVPKPRGYSRIDLPEKSYTQFAGECPYSFRYPAYAHIERTANGAEHPCWINVAFPRFNAKIHISYLPVNNNLGILLEDTYNFTYKHVQKADAINTLNIEQPEKGLYGILYDIKGNVASSKQFYLTDSTSHFLRGALYFYEVPNKDSLAPVLDFIAHDIDTLISSFKWE